MKRTTSANPSRVFRFVITQGRFGRMLSILGDATGSSTQRLRSHYERGIREAAAREERHRLIDLILMERLETYQEQFRDWVAADRPFLGICLGLQLLFEGSDEDGAATLGILSGRTVRLDGAPTLPHIGWNQVERRRDHPAFDGIAPGADFYFVHSYVGAPAGPDAASAVLAETEHGPRFVSAVARGRLLGVQFHPERSGGNGLRLVANVVRLAGAA